MLPLFILVLALCLLPAFTAVAPQMLAGRQKAAIAAVASLLSSSTLPATAYALPLQQYSGSSSVLVAAESDSGRKEGSVLLEGESLRMFRRARLYESDGDLIGNGICHGSSNLQSYSAS